MRATLKPNPRAAGEWRAALKQLASVAGKEDPEGIQKLALQSARRWIRNVADITPPATGSADAEAKARGEQAILDDLLKIAAPVTLAGASRRKAAAVVTSAQDLLTTYQAARDPRTGRVNPRNRKQLLYVPQAEFNRVLKRAQGRIGWLAAALNAAATRLGVSLPGWIKRHGAAYGSIEIRATAHGIRIAVDNHVKFVANVSDYARRCRFALAKEVRSLAAQARNIIQRRAKKAGFKLK